MSLAVHVTPQMPCHVTKDPASREKRCDALPELNQSGKQRAEWEREGSGETGEQREKNHTSQGVRRS